MKVLVCGSRTFSDEDVIHMVLRGLYRDWYERSTTNRFVVIEGGARGADEIAAWWADMWLGSIGHWQYPADWERHGKAAGHIRNQEMLDEGQPDVVWAFVDKPLEQSRGTADMVRRAEAAGIPVYVVEKR